MKTSDFYYDLPEELIAQHPLDIRSNSRLMVLDKNDGTVLHRHFYDIKKLLVPGDVLVVNNTRVIPARLLGVRSDTGTAIEILLLKRLDEKRWETLARPGKKVREGRHVTFIPGKLEAECEEVLPDGNRIVRFEYDGIFLEVLEKLGRMPLPPYIKKELQDGERYQTVYSKNLGSAAAPTAGLHFTQRELDALDAKGIKRMNLCLHVGAGTFLPVKSPTIGDHTMHSEPFSVSKDFLKALISKGETPLTAVGTTSTRCLESLYYLGVHCLECGEPGTVEQWEPYRQEGYSYPLTAALQALVDYLEQAGLEELHARTRIIIVPGYRFRLIDYLVTNFHQPKSTLLLLISAFVGDAWQAIYDFALSHDFRFLSYGDSSLLQKV